MRLIDAIDFKNKLYKIAMNGDLTYEEFYKFASALDNQPTVYDVDRVMEQIKEKGTAICCSVKCNDNCEDCDHGCLIKGILEIVKSGGVADE